MNVLGWVPTGAIVGIFVLGSTAVRAQPVSQQTFGAEPTQGLRLPGVGIAGQVDALSTVRNPAGLYFLPGKYFAVAVDFADEDKVVSPGQGVGLYYGQSLGGKLLPKIGLGTSLEFLSPARSVIEPDPGSPIRLNTSLSVPLSDKIAIGLSWDHYFDSREHILSGADTFSAGLAARLGAYVAIGAVVRDFTKPTFANVEVQPRYELELAVRPLATDRLEVGLGGRYGESGNEVDGWLRTSLRIVDGLYFRGQLSTAAVEQITRMPAGAEARVDERREYRLSAGFEVSFGDAGATFLANAALNHEDEGQFRGGTFIARLSSPGVPSLIPDERHLERLPIKNRIGDSELMRLVASMRRIERNDKIVGVLLDLDNVQAGWANLQELRRRILALGVAGKKVFAHLVSGTIHEYFLASAASQIFVDPAGGIYLTGFVGTVVYFKNLFDKLGIRAQFEKIKEYKSAPEVYTLSGPSEPAWRMRNELYDSLYAQYIAGIATGRGISERRARELIDQGPYSAGDLSKLPELVNAVTSAEKAKELIAKELGGVYPVKKPVYNQPSRWELPKIAVIHLNGDIVSGKSRVIPFLGRRLVGGNTMAEALRRARDDASIEAIVLRINSPGGSALASDIVSRVVFETRKKKPIICSLGNYAASGGYFVAAGCDYIVAEAMTITGSIGIFNGKFDLSRLLTRLGLTWKMYKRGKNADLHSMFSPWSDEQRKLVQKGLHYFYRRFIAAVARGRKMAAAEVGKIGRGRVWSGQQALELKLVDEIGGITEAIQKAKQRAGLTRDERVSLVVLPKPVTSLLNDYIRRQIGGGRSDESLCTSLYLLPYGCELARLLPASLLAEPTAAQARLPVSMVWATP